MENIKHATDGLMYAHPKDKDQELERLSAGKIRRGRDGILSHPASPGIVRRASRSHEQPVENVTALTSFESESI
jgi:hypothetical protein